MSHTITITVSEATSGSNLNLFYASTTAGATTNQIGSNYYIDSSGVYNIVADYPAGTYSLTGSITGNISILSISVDGNTVASKVPVTSGTFGPFVFTANSSTVNSVTVNNTTYYGQNVSIDIAATVAQIQSQLSQEIFARSQTDQIITNNINTVSAVADSALTATPEAIAAVLASLSTTQPTTPNTLWLDGGILAITPSS